MLTLDLYFVEGMLSPGVSAFIYSDGVCRLVFLFMVVVVCWLAVVLHAGSNKICLLKALCLIWWMWLAVCTCEMASAGQYDP